MITERVGASGVVICPSFQERLRVGQICFARRRYSGRSSPRAARELPVWHGSGSRAPDGDCELAWHASERTGASAPSGETPPSELSKRERSARRRGSAARRWLGES